MFGQARGKAVAVEGVRSPVIEIRDDQNRSMEKASGTLLIESDELPI
jgi:hypothetical protein